jgi:hypothetical protein
MSERIDRRIGNNHVLLAVVVIFSLAAGAGSYVWLHMRDQSAPPAPAQGKPSSQQTARPDEPLTITLYVPGNEILSSGLMTVKRQPDIQGQAREALTAVFADMRVVQSPVLKELKLREFFLDAAGTGYVDVVPAPQGGIKASAWEELLAVYSIVNTLTQNFDEIKRVRFLIDGKEAQLLAGHIDLSRMFTKRTDLMKQ